MRLKKIDRLVIGNFLPPLLIWTFIAMFIFNMQFLWKYIDDIIGKGLELQIILELLFYQSLAMIPRAMVFGLLIASVMTMGNFAEKYELVSMKSAGMSIFRIMRPLIALAAFLAIVSYYFSNNLIPYTALKFKSTLYDIRKQKPALSFQSGQFNDDFKDVAIFVDSKDKSGKTLNKLKIYDHTVAGGYKGQTNAKSGTLFFFKDTITESIKKSVADTTIVMDSVINKSYLVVKLKEGTRYEELIPENDRPLAYPHIEMKFETYTTAFDMSEFEFSETNENLFKGHSSLMTSSQLLRAVDSLKEKRFDRYKVFQKNADAMFYFRREGKLYSDTIELKELEYYKSYAPVIKDHSYNIEVDTTLKKFSDLMNRAKKDYLYQRAAGFCQNIKGQSASLVEYRKTNKRIHCEHENELHQKLSFAIALILFLFIGAPMGAIIRKGGFGWPILVAFIFFMVFFVLFMIGDNLAKKGEITTWIGSWLPNLILFPFGFFLTYKSLNDSRIVSGDRWRSFLLKFKNRSDA